MIPTIAEYDDGTRIRVERHDNAVYLAVSQLAGRDTVTARIYLLPADAIEIAKGIASACSELGYGAEVAREIRGRS